MNKEEWAALDTELSGLLGRAHLSIDGHAVTFEVQRHKMRLVISVFVGGWMKGEWLVKKTEECTRFCRPVQVSLYTPSRKKSIAKGFSKTAIKKYFPDFDKKGVYYSSCWLSFAPLKRHLLANNKSIALLSLGHVASPSPGTAAIETSPNKTAVAQP